MQHAMQNALSQVKDAPEIYLEHVKPDYPQLITRHLPKNSHAICDVNTRMDLPFPTLCLSDPPKASAEFVQQIRTATAKATALIAVGSGTINDLVKYAAFLDEKPYAVIATAASMNGYVSANASISVHGYKHTLPARGPVAVMTDIPMLSAAPAPLTRAGMADILCRSTVQADWLLSHLLLGTPYEPMYFDWLRENERKLLSLPDVHCLFEALIISGLAMRHCGSSAPASQGEHMIAHTREMLFPNLPSHFHGLEIAVTTLTMAKLQEKILSSPTPPIITLDKPENYLPSHLLQEAERQYQHKLPDQEKVRQLNRKLQSEWPHIRDAINAIRVPYELLHRALAHEDCPLTPQDLVWPADSYQQSVKAARFTRDRFTFLDLEMHS